MLQACHVRGLNTSNVSSEDLVSWLQDWIDLTKQVSGVVSQVVFRYSGVTDGYSHRVLY